MCHFTCANCRSTLNQRETQTHECPPRNDSPVSAAEIDAAARALWARWWLDPDRHPWSDASPEEQESCTDDATAALEAARRVRDDHVS